MNAHTITHATLTTDNNNMTTENEILDNGTLIENDANNVSNDLKDNNVIDDEKSIEIVDKNDLENKQESIIEFVSNNDDESLESEDDNDETGNSDLSKKDYDYFDELYKKYSDHKNPSQAMKLLLKLHDLETKTEADFAQIKILIRAERARVKAENARNRVNAIFKAEANAKRKAIENRKFILGGALYNGIENNLMLTSNISFKQIARMMIDKKMITGDDITKIRELIDTK